ncbi:ABC transporter ATP-binding protein [Helicovermis profundi]
MFLFIVDMVAAISVAGIDLLFPMFSREIINDYIPNKNVNGILVLTAIIVGLYIIRLGLYYIMAYWGHVLGSRMEYDVRKDLFSHIQNLPFNYFDENKTGQIMARLTGDLNEVSELAHHGPEDLFISLLMIFGSFFILMSINIELTLIIFSVVIVLIIYTITRRKSMTYAFRNVRKKNAEINSKIENSISGIRISKSFANRDYEIDRFDEFNTEYKNSKNNAYRAMGIFSSGTHFLADLLSVIVISVGGIFVYKGIINYGDLVAYLLYTSFFIRPIRRLIQFTQQYQSGMAGFERFIEIMDLETETIDNDDAIEVDTLKGDIKIDNISFKYNDNDKKYVLTKFNLEIEKGKTIALVGPSGVGKTTISNLIPRYYDVNEGTIYIDNMDIKNIKLFNLRNNIGIVQQDVFIFYGTIRENIIYGKPSASEEEVIEAAKNANIHEFIETLEYKYDTIVGERGIKLSGGQKQRIAIARVFIKNPPILILDEATSSLDNQNEIIIQDSIEKLSKGRTTIIIAHRLSTIMSADEILVLADTGIIERGNHSGLLSSNGLYSKLFNAQFKGFIPDSVS